jgi:tRNA(Ile)-lysidine synthase
MKRLVDDYFDRYGCPRRGSRILAAVSGGPDSMAVLAVLVAMAPAHRWTIGVAHVNHGLRGAQSDGDERHVAQAAQAWNLVLHTYRLDPSKKSTRENLHVWARRERYGFFDAIATRHGYNRIALGHHLNDRAETVAAAFLAADGTFALSGIPPVRGHIIRPLFDATHENILDYLRESDIRFRIDPSNASSRYERGRIRAEILPEWQRHNPNVVEGLARLGEQLWSQRHYLENQAERVVIRATMRSERGTLLLDTGRLRRYDSVLDPFVLRALFGRVGMEAPPAPATVERFRRLRTSDLGGGEAAIEQGRFQMLHSKGVLRVTLRQEPRADGAVAAPIEFTMSAIADTQCFRGDDRAAARFDCDTVQGKLAVRYPRPGDRYQPLGLKGTKKLYDLLADRHVPSFERCTVPVVVDELGILWPVGHPIAHRARLTKRTRRVVEARLREGSWNKES